MNVFMQSSAQYVMTSKHFNHSALFVNKCILILASYNWLKMYGFSDVNLLGSPPCTALHLGKRETAVTRTTKHSQIHNHRLNKTKCILNPITGRFTLKVF